MNVNYHCRSFFIAPLSTGDLHRCGVSVLLIPEQVAFYNSHPLLFVVNKNSVKYKQGQDVL